MLEETFDRIIQDKLQSHEVAFVPEDWEILAKELQEGPNPLEAGGVAPVFESFDDAIRSKIDSFSVEDSPSIHWKELSEKMYGAFDTSIEGRLNSYEVPYDPANWEAMVEHLEKPFYQLFQQRLGKFRVPFMRQDWKHMQQALDTEMPAPVPKVYERWEVFAVAASLAFLLMFLPMIQSPRSGSGTAEIIAQEPGREQESSSLDTQDSKESSTPNQDEEPILNSPLIAELNTGSTLPSPPAGNSTTEELPSDVPLSTTQAELSPDLDLDILDKVEALPPVQIRTGTYREKLPVVAFEKKERLPVYNESSGIIFPVSTSSTSDFSKEIDLIPTEAIELTGGRNRIHPEFLLGMYFGNTSSRVELNDKGGQGIAGGLRVEVKFTDQVSVVTGIQYAEKSFNHQFSISQTLDNASGPTRTSQGLEAEFRTIELPTLVRFRLPSDERNSLYVQTGIVSFYMVDESYKRFDPASPQNTELISSGGGVVSDPTENLNHTDHRQSLSTYIANFHAAIGWEYKISDRLLLQLEPYFQMGLQEMGPPGATPAEENKLYTGGFGASLFYDLSQKSKKSKSTPSKLF